MNDGPHYAATLRLRFSAGQKRRAQPRVKIGTESRTNHRFEGTLMSIGVLSMVRLSPERASALTAAGCTTYAQVASYTSRDEACRDGGGSIRAVLTNGRGGLSGAEMALPPNLEVVCAVGAGYEAVDLDTARGRGIAVAKAPTRTHRPSRTPR